jgi:hypothetical protein
VSGKSGKRKAEILGRKKAQKAQKAQDGKAPMGKEDFDH